MPTISVIVPVYNTEKYLHRCIDSILTQTFTDFELLLIDDGSADNSGAICDEYASMDFRVRVFHKENGGASSARNLGLDFATGKWVTFCDSDDWVDASWLMNYIQHMDNCDLVEQGICFDKTLIENQNESSYVGLRYVGTVNGFLNEMANSGLVGYTVIKCFRRSIIELNKLRFDTRFNYHEDEEFVLRYLPYCGNIVSVDTPGYNYIMPNFESKYPTVKNGYYLYSSLYSRAIEISLGELSGYARYALNSMMFYFVAEFSQKSFIKRCHFLRKTRQLLGPNILKSNIFCLSKYAILVDFTGIFASLILTMHLFLKSFLKISLR